MVKKHQVSNGGLSRSLTSAEFVTASIYFLTNCDNSGNRSCTAVKNVCHLGWNDSVIRVLSINTSDVHFIVCTAYAFLMYSAMGLLGFVWGGVRREGNCFSVV